MKGVPVLAIAILLGIALSGCDSKQTELQVAEARLETLKAEIAAKHRLQEEQDQRDAPFGSKLNIDSLSKAEKKRLCGDEYHRIAIGWPIKKALACSGDNFRLASEAGNSIRIWQDCDRNFGCLTIGESDGRVSNWNR